MKVYLITTSSHKVRADIDVIDGVLQVNQIKDVIKGLILLGKKVMEINLFSAVYCDLDQPYYNKNFPESDLEKLYKDLHSVFSSRFDKVGFFVYRNFFCTYTESGKRLIMPGNLCNLYDDKHLTLSFTIWDADESE